MKGLYPIVDLDTLAAAGISPIAFAERVLAARPPLLQLRAKHESARATLALLGALKPLCARAHTLLFANDRADLALLAGTDGVHIGQDDLPLAAVRRMAPSLKVGVSTHDLEQLERALAERPDYVAFGPVFSTGSKLRPDPVVGLEGLASAAARARAAGIPLVAIGGITLPRAAEVAALGALAAVIAGLISESLDETQRRAGAFQQTLSDSVPLDLA